MAEAQVTEASDEAQSSSAEADQSALPAVAQVPRCAVLVSRLGNLAPHPRIAAAVVALLNKHNPSTGGLAKLVVQDVALASRFMRIANSANYGKPRQILSIDQALMRLGMRTLRGVLTEATIRCTERDISPTEQSIWENSVVTAIACRETASFLRKSQLTEELFLLGLFHDIGKFAMLSQLPELYAQVMDLCRTGMTFVDAEKRIFTYAHQLSGSMLATRWNLPEQHCKVILNHHLPLTAAPKGPVEAKRAVVQFADFAAHHLGYGHDDGYPSMSKELNQLARLLGFKRSGIDTILKRVENQIGQLPVPLR